MILKIRHSVLTKLFSFTMIWVFCFTLIVPINSFGLTGGPAQPEFNSFTPIGTSDMVDLASGDFSYNIPLMDIGGFPINLAYSSGVTMDQESSWVGLGWDLSIGQINRQMRGIPDDFDGDKMEYQNDMKDNFTVGGSLKVLSAVAGIEKKPPTPSLSTGISAEYNSYTGFSMKRSLGITTSSQRMFSVGFDVESGPDGMSLSPSVGFNGLRDSKIDFLNNIGSKIGTSFNSRQGLVNVNMSASHASPKAISAKRIGSSISFLPNHYTPQVQANLNNSNVTFNAALGGEYFAAESQGQIRAFYANQGIPDALNTMKERAYGFDNNHKATENDVKDFNREKKSAIGPNSTNLPITNFTYDIYSISGQGVGGTFRPFRSRIGYVNDRKTTNLVNGESLGIELGVGNTNHIGSDIETTEGISYSGIWADDDIDNDDPDDNNSIDLFDSDPTEGTNSLYEEVYYKNVGDLSGDRDESPLKTDIEPMRLKLGTVKYERSLEKKYLFKSDASGTAITQANVKRNGAETVKRRKRNQSILKIRADEVATDEVAIDGGYLLGFSRNLNAKDHHTAGFIVTRNDGARYIYGDALYNTKKEEVSFAMGGSSFVGDCEDGLIEYDPGIDNDIKKNKNADQFFNKVTTPAYAHTFLLTSLVSTDYSDLTEDGLSIDDLGSWTKFTYETNGNYNWRVPFKEDHANFNEGIKADPEDDRASYVYGEKETKYIKKIETKTHIAVFNYIAREDGFGVTDENGGLNGSSNMKALDYIELFSQEEYDNGNGTPIKTVHFKYSYRLCQNLPNNQNFDEDFDVSQGNGKLTLERIYFTYRDSKMGKYSPYKFTYDISNNPNYNLKEYNVWGGFKPMSANISSTCGVDGTPPIPEFNYIEQNDTEENLNKYASSWSLTNIKLPSGGTISVDYESDDYAYVQDKKAMQMFKVVGAGTEKDPTSANPSQFYPNDILKAKLFDLEEGQPYANHLYIEVDGVSDDQEFYNQYIKELVENYKKLMQFRFFVNMGRNGGKNNANTTDIDNAKFDYVNGYCEVKELFDADGNPNYGVFTDGGVTYASIPIVLVDLDYNFSNYPVNPMAKAGWQYARKFLSNYIYDLGGVDNSGGVKQMANHLFQHVENLKEIFTGPNKFIKGKKIARRFAPQKSWVRLMNNDGFKKGGGCRVKTIRMSDQWDVMTANETATNTKNAYSGVAPLARTQEYGQEYNYNIVDKDNNSFSSGVATYEPLGAFDNPLIQPIFVQKNRLLGPDEENYMETPFGESFFPSPKVTYSRVEVSNLNRDPIDIDADGMDEILKSHATGKVVTEFYTSKDFPTICDQTPLKIEEDGGKLTDNLIQNILSINVRKHLALSQGYSIHNNDMDGKMKRQLVYEEGNNDPISGAMYLYQDLSNNIGSGPIDPVELTTSNNGKLHNLVKVLKPNGELKYEKLGFESSVVNDFREMYSETTVRGVNMNTANFFTGIPNIIPMPLPNYSHSETKVKIAVTTKVMNTFGILKETIAFDNGAAVSTKNICWDSETGEVLVTETSNEYGDKYYSMNYPAHWLYKNMGQSAYNIGAEFDVTEEPSDGTYKFPTITIYESDFFSDGDEVIFKNDNVEIKLWVTDVTENGFNLIKHSGEKLTEANGVIKVIRSGKRNLQSTSMGSLVSQKNPLEVIDNVTGDKINASFFDFGGANTHDFKVINADAIGFSDDWNDACYAQNNSVAANVYNPYVLNLKGIYRAIESHLYLTERYQNTNALGTADDVHSATTNKVDPRNDGFYTSFKPYYVFGDDGDPNNGNGIDWYSDNTNWTSTSIVTRYNPSGFEIENKDALGRFSSAQYGYNNMFPMSVVANSKYSSMGFDGFEEYDFDNFDKRHLNFRDAVDNKEATLDNFNAHTGKHSLRIAPGQKVKKVYRIETTDCTP